MAEFILTEDELKEFNEGYKATNELVKKHPETPSELRANNSALIQVISIYQLTKSSKRLEESSRRLEKSSENLNRLTWALIGLTAVLLIVTVWSIGLSLFVK
jgi:hypothetical protein